MKHIDSGDRAHYLELEFKLANYGKSPAIEISRDARIAIGSVAARRITLRKGPDKRGRIIPPGDRPSIYAYSEQPLTQEEFKQIVAGRSLVIIYGSIEYTDLLGDPKPRYVTEFCSGIIAAEGLSQEADAACKNHTRMQ